MTQSIMSLQTQNRSLDITAIENALVDMLIRGTDSDLKNLSLAKGGMRLVDSSEQKKVFQAIENSKGQLKAEVEVGGSAANVLRAMALLGAKASYSSVVGNDTHGHSFAGRLDALGIINRLRIVDGGDTGTCLVVVTPDGERTMNTHLGVCVQYSHEQIPVSDIQASKIFFTTGYAWDTQGQKAAIRSALKTAKESDCLVALDLADPFVVTRSGDELKEILRDSVDIAFANSAEIQILVGVSGKEGAKRLGELVRIAVVKDGAGGSYVASNGEVFHTPAPQVNVVDTTGAGDFYAGGFLFGISRNLPLPLCAKIATALGSHVVEHLGVRYSDDLPKKISELIKNEK